MRQRKNPPPARDKKAPLWRCPLCGHRFVTRNMWHSCSNYRLSDHFARCQPGVRRLFRELTKVVRSFGRVEIYAQKSRIVFQVRVRFVSVMIRRSYLLVNFWLTRKIADPQVLRVESLYPAVHIHQVRIGSSKDMTVALRDWLREAYAVGRREHLNSRRKAPTITR